MSPPTTGGSRPSTPMSRRPGSRTRRGCSSKAWTRRVAGWRADRLSGGVVLAMIKRRSLGHATGLPIRGRLCHSAHVVPLLHPETVVRGWWGEDARPELFRRACGISTAEGFGELLMTYLSEVLSAAFAVVVAEATRIYLVPAFSTWWWPVKKAGVPQLKGTWRYDQGTLEINQYGTTIKAKATRTEADNVRHFIYEGRLMGGQLVLTWKQSGGEGHIVGAMVLRIAGDGNQLEGMTTYLQHDTATVRSDPRTYTRA